MGADGTCDEGKRILIENDLQGLLKLTCSRQLQVSGDILMDRASFLAGGDETIRQRNRLIDFPGRKGLYCLYMMLVGLYSLHKAGCLGSIHALKGSGFSGRKQLSNLLQSLIAARL